MLSVAIWPFARKVLVLVFTIGVTTTTLPARAGIDPTPFIDWNLAFLLQGSSPLGDDPRVIFGFNPQPEPPIPYFGRLDLTAPAAPAIVNQGTFNPGTAFDMYLGVLLPAVRVSLEPNGTFPPDPIMTLGFGVFDSLGNRLFDVFVDFESSSGGVLDGASAVAFNPQPEPPLPFGPEGDFGISFTFTSFSDVTATLRMLDANDNPVTFQRVPEAGTLPALILGLLALALVRRRVRDHTV